MGLGLAFGLGLALGLGLGLGVRSAQQHHRRQSAEGISTMRLLPRGGPDAALIGLAPMHPLRGARTQLLVEQAAPGQG